MTDSNQNQERPEVPVAGIVYGEIVYWGTILAAVIAIIGSVVTFVTTQNVMNPTYLLAALWDGKDVATVWHEAAGGTPNGHWYLRELMTGNGLTMAGIALGVFIVIPAIVASGIVLTVQRQRLFAVLAFAAAAITAVAMSGMLNFIFVQPEEQEPKAEQTQAVLNEATPPGHPGHVDVSANASTHEPSGPA